MATNYADLQIDTIAQYKTKNPDKANIPDEELALALHQYTPDIPWSVFYSKVMPNEYREKPTAIERFGRGMTDVAMGVGQLTGQMQPIRNALSYLPGGEVAGASSDLSEQEVEQLEKQENLLYERGQGDEGLDWWRVGGQAAATAPLAFLPGAAATGLVGRTAMGSLTGGLAGTSIYADEPGERLYNTGIGLGGGALFGALARPVVEAGGALLGGAGRLAGDIYGAASRAGRGLLGNLEGVAARTREQIKSGLNEAAGRAGISLEDLGEAFTAQLEARVAQALNRGEKLDYAALIRQARAEKHGFEGDAAMMRAQATQDPVAYTELKEASKLMPEGEQLIQRQQNQSLAAERAMDDLAPHINVDPVLAGDSLINLARSRAALLQTKVAEAYRAVRGGGSMPRDSLHNRTAQILSDHEGQIAPSIVKRIARLIDPDSNIAFTGDELIKLDKLISETMPPGLDAAQNLAAGKLKKAVMGVIDDAAEGAPSALKAAYTAAKKLARERFEMIGEHNGLVSQMLHGTVDPKDVVTKIARGRIRDLRTLKKFMSEDQWETVQRSVENYIVTAARRGGDEPFNQVAYRRTINNMGRERLKTIFGEQRMKDLFEKGLAFKDIFGTPAYSFVNRSNTAATAANLARDVGAGLLDLIPGVGRLGGKALDRVAEQRAAGAASRTATETVEQALSPQPPPPPRMGNPAAPLLPYVGAFPPAAGLLGAETFR